MRAMPRRRLANIVRLTLGWSFDHDMGGENGRWRVERLPGRSRPKQSHQSLGCRTHVAGRSDRFQRSRAIGPGAMAIDPVPRAGSASVHVRACAAHDAREVRATRLSGQEAVMRLNYRTVLPGALEAMLGLGAWRTAVWTIRGC